VIPTSRKEMFHGMLMSCSPVWVFIASHCYGMIGETLEVAAQVYRPFMLDLLNTFSVISSSKLLV